MKKYNPFGTIAIALLLMLVNYSCMAIEFEPLPEVTDISFAVSVPNISSPDTAISTDPANGSLEYTDDIPSQQVEMLNVSYEQTADTSAGEITENIMPVFEYGVIDSCRVGRKEANHAQASTYLWAPVAAILALPGLLAPLGAIGNLFTPSSRWDIKYDKVKSTQNLRILKDSKSARVCYQKRSKAHAIYSKLLGATLTYVGWGLWLTAVSQ